MRKVDFVEDVHIGSLVSCAHVTCKGRREPCSSVSNLVQSACAMNSVSAALCLHSCCLGCCKFL